MSDVRKPDFFIVGAPKSGTTSLYYYLKSHPEVFLPRRKELLFFCDDLHFTFPLLNEQQFLDYYKESKNENAIGEVGVWNLYSSHAAKNIFQFNPQAKIIAIVRNPVDMLYSLHSNHVFNQNENIADFGEAWRAEADRKEGKRISPVIKCPVEGLYYSEIAKYSEQLQRYINLFGKDRVWIFLYDDLSSRPKEMYTELLRFLSVTEIVPPDFKVYNSSKTIRSSWMRNMTINAPAWIRRTGRTLFPHQSRRRDWLMKTLWQINTREAERKKLDSSLRQQIIEHYLPDIHRLEEMLQRDLAGWYKIA